MKKSSTLLAGTVLALTALPAFAGVVITQKQNMVSGPNTRDSDQTIMLQGNKQKMVTDKHTIITDLDKGAVYILDPAAKTYFQIEFPPKGQMAAMMAASAPSAMNFKKSSATRDIAGAMNAILADVYALYFKTKNFHWHLSGPHFRDYHLLFDEQGDQLFAMADPIAERIRKVGGSTIRSIGHVGRLQRVKDNDAEYVDPKDMLAELRENNKELAARLREVHDVCDEHRDIATASLIEVWIDETERRTWFLFEAGRQGDSGR